MNKKVMMWMVGGGLAVILIVSVYLPRVLDTKLLPHSTGEMSGIESTLLTDVAMVAPNPTNGWHGSVVANVDAVTRSTNESESAPSGLSVEDSVAPSSSVAAGLEGASTVADGSDAINEAEASIVADGNAEQESSPKPTYARHGGGGRSVAEILEGVDLSNEAERARVVAEMTAVEEARYAAVLAKAKDLGIPVRKEGPGSRVAILHDFRGDEPLYRITLNKNAAISSAANLLYPVPYNLDGTGVKVGVWDAGAVLNTHQELSTTRVVKRNAVATDPHATHVAGTIGASGVNANAKGMAPNVKIDSWDWYSDYTEMTSSGAATANDTNNIPISNHSYGYGATNTDMGRYEYECVDVDSLTASLPFYLPCWAAGNEQDELTAKDGFQSITFNGLAKNVLTVGAVQDAVSGGVRSPANGTMTYFSSWGPCDDGRIKPDVVANGYTVYSPDDTSTTSYDTYNGTSMATPSTAGSAALLTQLYAREFSNQWMRASLLKGLLIHTADDLGTAGPDYKFGWGLINVEAAADVILAHKASLGSSPKLFTNSVSTAVAGQTNTFIWDGTSPIRVTLCWTDPAGAAQADNSRTPNLRNNLDLRVTAPDGTTVHMPYVMPFVGTWSDASMTNAAITGDNNVDNVERVDIASPTQAGVYTVTVVRDGILYSSPQAYSLIITGSGEGADQPPLLAPIGARQVNLGSNVAFTVSASDPVDGDSITLSAANLPANAVFSTVTNTGGVTNTFTWNNASPTGTYNVTFQAVDKDGTNTEVVAITVFLASPTAPASLWASATNSTDFTAAWSSVANATGYRLDVSTNANFAVSTGGGGAVQLGESLTSGLSGSYTTGDVSLTSGVWNVVQVLGENAADSYGGTGGAARLNDDTPGACIRTPALDTVGSITFWYRELNTGGGEFVLQKSYDGSIWIGVHTQSFSGTTYVRYSNDVDDAAATVTLRVLNDNQAGHLIVDEFEITSYGASTPDYIVGYSNRTVSGTSENVTGLAADGTYYFRARAVNAAGSSANSSVANVTTLATLSAPVFGANPGPVATTVGLDTEFTVSASSVPTPALSLDATTVAVDDYDFDSGTGDVLYIPPQGDAGVQTFTFSAVNSQGSASQIVTVNVAAATAPAFTGGVGPYSTTAGVEVAFTVSASGTPTPTLALQSQTASSGYSFTPATGAFTYTPPVGDVGTPTFTFTAANAAGTVTQVTSVTVSAVPTAPEAPASIWASATNATNFTAAWSASGGATSYRLDVGTNATFAAGGGSVNLMSNAGFESGDSTSWTKFETDYAVVTTDPQEGIYHVSCVSTGTRDLMQPVAITGDGVTEYEVSFWYKKPAAGNARIWATWPTGGQVSGDDLTPDNSYLPVAADWTKVTYTVVPQSGANTLNFEVRTYNGTTVYWDNFFVGIAGSGSTPSYVPGYSNRTVSGESESVTGLVAETTYYFRARAVNAVGTSGDSSTANVTTKPEETGTPPTMDSIPAQTTYVGAEFEYTVTATEPDLDAMTFACTSAVNTNIWDFDTGDGYFVFYPEVAQRGTNLFNFTATDKDGTSAPVQMSVKVYSAAATNEFTQWIEDQQENPAAPGFAPNEDADDDGVSNYDEYLADTDPTSSNSVLKLDGDYFIASEVGEDSGQIEFSFPASPARYYQLVYSTNLASPTLTNNLGLGVPPIMTITSAAPAAWYGTIR
ncbi:MAG: S8 family serine peptidase, partial [Kiritimatiellae bacterium]|nr:S8 family serine peptidase [Kiritimatiellia bacterium]